jgi:enoyl-CoA hydratase/carnithine racemase
MVMKMLRRAVGEKRAFDLVATGRELDAVEAERIGLISRVLPHADFDTDAARIVEAIAAFPATPLAATKALMYELDSLDFNTGIAAGIRVNADSRSTPEFATGLRRFLARRKGGK